VPGQHGVRVLGLSRGSTRQPVDFFGWLLGAKKVQHRVQATVVDGVRGFFSNLWLGMVGHRESGDPHHGQVIGAVAHHDGLRWT